MSLLVPLTAIDSGRDTFQIVGSHGPPRMSEVNCTCPPTAIAEDSMRRTFKASIAFLLMVISIQAQSTKRPLTLDDLAKIRTVGDPQVSPDAKWVAYTVGAVDPGQYHTLTTPSYQRDRLERYVEWLNKYLK